MAAKRKFSKEIIRQMLADFHTTALQSELGDKYGCDFHRSIRPLWVEAFGEEAIRDRFRKACARSKTGDKNPMKGKTGKLHHRFVEVSYDSSGYRLVEAPDWYEGKRTKGAKVLEHIVIGCVKYGLTKLPEKHVIHHIDHSKTNNHPDNLQLMTIAEHMAHHCNARRKVPEEGATTRPRGRRKEKKLSEARSVPKKGR